MSSTIFANARILTLAGDTHARRGLAMRDLGVIDRGYVVVEGDRIKTVEVGELPESVIEEQPGEIIDAAGAVLMPAWVDCHTHACWAGSRLDEFEMTLAGRPYLDILESGGGIMSTVRAVRDATDEELVINLLRRLSAMMALGTGTVEIKSGYGLRLDTELKMLRAVHAVTQIMPQTIVGTFLGAHAIDPENQTYVDDVINDMLPAVVSEFPRIVCDAYCEDGAWSVADCVRLFRAAADLGCPIRVHADQFNALGMTREAIGLGAVSVDHLEATTEAEMIQLAESNTFGVMLPACAFHLDDRYAPGRAFIDAGGALAIATNFNPGSAPSPSMPFTIALACRKLGLTVAEAITCATWNPACLLGLQQEVGAIIPGHRAHLQLLETMDERELAHEFAGAGPLIVMLDGMIVHARAVDQDDDFDEEDFEEDDEVEEEELDEDDDEGDDE